MSTKFAEAELEAPSAAAKGRPVPGQKKPIPRPASSSVSEVLMDVADERVTVAKGVANAVLISLPFWVLLFFTIFMLF